jgi:peptidoglycan/LPS O-acetylase OafA/YrhL
MLSRVCRPIEFDGNTFSIDTVDALKLRTTAVHELDARIAIRPSDRGNEGLSSESSGSSNGAISSSFVEGAQHTRYRADIDGLRAFAVIPVVFFHLGGPIFTGGFVGVDVFFVISGYLITSIISLELAAGNFSILSFYQRRIRRIFPALSSIIFFCIVVGFFLLTPNDYKILGESIVATTFFVSNIFFWRGTNYVAAPAGDNPLLHTWSLSIEEQFYLVYPWILLLLSRWQSIRITVICVLCVLSFVLGAALVEVRPAAAFYLGPPRAWELLVGGLIAFTGPLAADRRVTRELTAVIGALLILSSMLLYSATVKFPGLSALPPVVGTALIIWSGKSQPAVVHRVLSLPALTAIGKASYSLYLWHFPLISFLSYALLNGLDAIGKAIVFSLSLLISLLSLRYVELPFRSSSACFRIVRPVSSLVCLMAIGCGLGLFVEFEGGLPARLNPTSAKYLEAEGDKDRHHMECMSLLQRIVRPSEACRLGFQDATPHVLLWGDSHAVVTGTAMEAAALRHRASFLLAASVDCPVGFGFDIDAATGPEFVSTPAYQYCGEYNREMLKLVQQDPDLDTVVLSSRWTNWRIGEPGARTESKVDIRLKDAQGAAGSPEANKAIFVRGFNALLQALAATKKSIWIVGPLPEPAFRIPKTLYVKHLVSDRADIDVPVTAFLSKHKFILSLFDSAQKVYPIKLIWPHLAICSADTCRVVESGNPVFFDDNHLSVFGARKTSYLYDQIFDRSIGGQGSDPSK